MDKSSLGIVNKLAITKRKPWDPGQLCQTARGGKATEQESRQAKGESQYDKENGE